jgi:hypothetical protein
MRAHVTWHWVCVEDVDLAFILDLDPERLEREDLVDAIREMQDIVEDGLETA